jgi:hypothetical protein
MASAAFDISLQVIRSNVCSGKLSVLMLFVFYVGLY